MPQFLRGLGKLLFILAQPLLIVYFKLHPTPRVRVIVKDDSDNILLIKGWFSSQSWELPGGGIEKGESPVQAAQRELLEETGLQVDSSALESLGTAVHTNGHLSYRIELLSCHVPSLSEAKLGTDRWWEIISVQFFPVRHLPSDTGHLVQRSLLRAREMNG